MKLATVILAAGLGKRMKSEIPKVIHPVLGRPMLCYVVDAVRKLSPSRIVIVIGKGSRIIREAIGNEGIEYVVQDEQLGTGHAANCARGVLEKFRGNVLILNGDFPQITTKTLKKFATKHEKDKSVVSVLTADVDDPSGYGRVLRDDDRNVVRIVEDRDADSDQKNISEVNSGTYCIKSSFIWDALAKLNQDNQQGEYYLTDIVEIASADKRKTSGIIVNDSAEILGVNDRVQLHEVNEILKRRTNIALMRSGVTIIDPESTYISPTVKIGADTIIYPQTHIYGDCGIGKGSVIGPSVWIEASKLGKGTIIRASCYIINSLIGDDVAVGPFAHIRPETHVMDGAKIGNFVEIKKSKIGKGSKVSHLSYIGDAELGRNVNIGAGTITCNYDGVHKHETRIGDNVFIGSDTMLVAPINIGKNAMTGAGSTITKDVPDGALAIGRARQTMIEKWKKKPRSKKGKL